MRKRIQKKSEVLREGYIKGLRTAQRIINETLYQSQGFDDDIDEFGGSGTVSGRKYAVDKNKLNAELLQAAERGELRRVKSLLDNGADVNAKDREGKTPLHLAAWGGYTRVCKLLLDYGADANAKDFGDVDGECCDTPLDCAAYGNHVETCQFLLDNGAKIPKGRNEWYWCTDDDNDEARELLKRYGAKLRA